MEDKMKDKRRSRHRRPNRQQTATTSAKNGGGPNVGSLFSLPTSVDAVLRITGYPEQLLVNIYQQLLSQRHHRLRDDSNDVIHPSRHHDAADDVTQHGKLTTSRGSHDRADVTSSGSAARRGGGSRDNDSAAEISAEDLLRAVENELEAGRRGSASHFFVGFPDFQQTLPTFLMDEEEFSVDKAEDNGDGHEDNNGAEDNNGDGHEDNNGAVDNNGDDHEDNNDAEENNDYDHEDNNCAEDNNADGHEDNSGAVGNSGAEDNNGDGHEDNNGAVDNNGAEDNNGDGHDDNNGAVDNNGDGHEDNDGVVHNNGGVQDNTGSEDNSGDERHGLQIASDGETPQIGHNSINRQQQNHDNNHTDDATQRNQNNGEELAQTEGDSSERALSDQSSLNHSVETIEQSPTSLQHEDTPRTDVGTARTSEAAASEDQSQVEPLPLPNITLVLVETTFASNMDNSTSTAMTSDREAEGVQAPDTSETGVQRAVVGDPGTPQSTSSPRSPQGQHTSKRETESLSDISEDSARNSNSSARPTRGNSTERCRETSERQRKDVSRSRDREVTTPETEEEARERRRQLERLRALRAENRRLRARNTCRECGQRPVSLTLLPCGHFCYCQECGSSFSACPLCHKTILADVRTFVS